MNLAKLSGQNYFALLLIFLGSGFLLQTLGYFDFGWILSQWWPLLIIVFGIIEFSKPSQRKIGPALVILFGTILLFSRFNAVDVNFWAIFWPLVLIFVGGSILFRQAGDKVVSDKSVDTFVLMSGTEKRLNSEDFVGGSSVTLFGGTVIDLRQATLAKDAKLDLLTFAGGVEIFVPEGCQVNNQLLVLMGGVEDKTQDVKNPTQTLTLTGTVLMGGVDIKLQR